MNTWMIILLKWIDAGASYPEAVKRANEYGNDHQEVDLKHDKLLADYKRPK